jgi:probable phosphoglycerate mutase
MTSTEPEIPPEGFRQHRFAAPPGATTVLLVRHGESAPAHPDRPFPLRDGHGDPPLDPFGVEQAELLAQRLASDAIAALYVTPLRRTQETAAPLAQRLGLTPIVEPDLREVFLGEWEEGEFRRRAAVRDPIFEQIFVQERWDVIPGAEPHDEFDARVWRGFQRVVAAHADERVVVVAHGGVIGQLLHRVTSARRFAFSGADNASISEVVADPNRIILRRYNDVAHLLPLLTTR